MLLSKGEADVLCQLSTFRHSPAEYADDFALILHDSHCVVREVCSSLPKGYITRLPLAPSFCSLICDTSDARLLRAVLPVVPLSTQQ